MRCQTTRLKEMEHKWVGKVLQLEIQCARLLLNRKKYSKMEG